MSAGRLLVAAAIVGCCMTGVSGFEQSAARQTGSAPAVSPAPQSFPKPTDKFDPKRDAAKDIEAAVAEAKRTKRRVILDVGGEWCSWCHTLDKYFVAHPDLAATRDRLYVWIKVHWSTEFPNEAVLSKYPKIVGYPHLFVLDQEGKLVRSQNTEELEEGSSYNLDKMNQFLLRWSGGK
jgi:thiol:disulfide interchange protein